MNQTDSKKLNKFFKFSNKVPWRVLVSEDGQWISDGFVAFNRNHYYVTPLEKGLVINTKADPVKNESIDRLYKDKPLTKCFIDNQVLIDHSDVYAYVYLEGQPLVRRKINARFLAAFYSFLKNKKYLSLDLFAVGNESTGPIVAKFSGNVVAIAMPVLS